MSYEPTQNAPVSSNNGAMEQALSLHKKGYARKLYKAEADAHKAEELQKDIRTKSEMLYSTNEQNKVDFNDLEDIKRRTKSYLDACAATGTFPSMMGLASYGYGISRQNLYWRLRNHPDSEVSRFIDRVRDLIADVLAGAALKRNADNVTTIFILKNGLGFSDRVELEAVTQEPDEHTYSAEDIMKRYSYETEE